MGCCSDISVEEKKNKLHGNNRNNNSISNKQDNNHLNNDNDNNVNKSEFNNVSSSDSMNNINKKSLNKKNNNISKNKKNKEEKKREPEEPKKIVQEIKPEKIEIKKNGKNEIDGKKDEEIRENQKKFAQKALNRNNYYRELYEVDKLELDDYLIKRANIIAKEYLTKGDFGNDNLLYENFEDVGINDFFSDKELEPEKLIDIWSNERKIYNYQDINEIECKNFTQMIWKNSKKFGIGYSSSNDVNINNGTGEYGKKKFYYVALYYPIGNKSGEFEENVKNIDIDEKIRKRKEEEERRRKEEEEKRRKKEEEEERRKKAEEERRRKEEEEKRRKKAEEERRRKEEEEEERRRKEEQEKLINGEKNSNIKNEEDNTKNGENRDNIKNGKNQDKSGKSGQKGNQNNQKKVLIDSADNDYSISDKN